MAGQEQNKKENKMDNLLNIPVKQMSIISVGADISMKLYKNRNRFQEVFPHIIEELLNNKGLKEIQITLELKGSKIIKIVIRPKKKLS